MSCEFYVIPVNLVRLFVEFPWDFQLVDANQVN
jgi:hypothetical protein